MINLYKKVVNDSTCFSDKLKSQLFKQLSGTHYYLGGSFSRNEALPMSDLDIVRFDQGVLPSLSNIEEIDRVDDLVIRSYRIARSLIDRLSPEAGFLDSTPLNGEKHPYFDLVNSKEFLINKALWEVEFSRRYNERSSKAGLNLKYSPGAYRDIWLIDLLARCIRGRQVTSEPEIHLSVETLTNELHLSENEVSMLKYSIAIIMIVKSAVLMAHRSTQSRGRTELNLSSMAHTQESCSVLRQLSESPKRVLAEYGNAKLIISRFTDRCARIIEESFQADLWDSVHTALMHCRGEIEVQFKDLEDDKRLNIFPIFACLIYSKRLSSSQLGILQEMASNDPGHNYTNRLLAKSPLIPKESLLLLYKQNVFALDSATNDRYRSLVKSRMEVSDGY